MSVLAVRGLAVAVGGRTVVRDLDLRLGAGERLAILGRNGAGKTTLLHTLAGLRPAAAGAIELCGDALGSLAPRRVAQLRGVLLQQQFDAFPASVLETALIGRHPWLERWAWESAADARIADAALTAVGLDGFAARDVHTLSGGERQRLAIATLLTQQPRLALLDEPLSHLDLNHQIATLELLTRKVRETGMALAMVMHDPGLAARYADRALLLHGDGRVETGAVADLLTAERLSALYQHPLRMVEADGQRCFLPV
ncbi:MAG: ABC transporter ATP-binding protein [Sulfuritalea sp.]|nr:ABC transporter ATP-binding protein [Sulfuritalea sp.]MDP1981680.1 ABC transporter ATP-binding protein [Sulfuritalea sp.]